MFSLICTLNKRLSKQSWGWWFEPSRSLHCVWRHCNAMLFYNPLGTTFRENCINAEHCFHSKKRILDVAQNMNHFVWAALSNQFAKLSTIALFYSLLIDISGDISFMIANWNPIRNLFACRWKAKYVDSIHFWFWYNLIHKCIWHDMTMIMVPDSTKPLREPMMSYYQNCHSPDNYFVRSAHKLAFKISTIYSGPMSYDIWQILFDGTMCKHNFSTTIRRFLYNEKTTSSELHNTMRSAFIYNGNTG